MTTPQRTRSVFDPTKAVLAEPWSPNPLLADAEQSVPETVNLAKVTGGDPPDLFEAGALPSITASGIDPELLTHVPAVVRHTVATEPDRARVLALLERYAQTPPSIDTAIPPGYQAYEARFRDWLAGKWVNPSFAGTPPSDVADAEAGFYDSLFGATDAAHTARVNAVNATHQPMPRTAQDRIGFAQR
jgi:hypothetical protein